MLLSNVTACGSVSGGRIVGGVSSWQMPGYTLPDGGGCGVRYERRLRIKVAMAWSDAGVSSTATDAGIAPSHLRLGVSGAGGNSSGVP